MLTLHRCQGPPTGRSTPRFVLVARLTAAIERQLGFGIDPRDVVAESQRFLTCSTCSPVGPTRCLPGNAHDEFGAIKPA